MSERFVETNGVRLWCETLGDAEGPQVVLVSGATASVVWWGPAFVGGLTGRGWQVIQFDNRDIGLSTHVVFAARPYTLADMATDTAGLLDALGIDRAHLAGVSLGGMICQLLALGQPDRVLSLTLISTSPGPSDARLSPPSAAIAEVALREATTPEQRDQRTLDLYRALSGNGRVPFDEAGTRHTIAADNARGTNPNPAHAIVAATAPSWLGDLGQISAPTLVVHGTKDPMFPFDHAEALAEAIPSAQLVAWEGVGHGIPPQLVPELLERMDNHFRSR